MYRPVSDREIKRKKQSHGQGKITDTEEPVQNIVGIGIRRPQGITAEFEQTHRYQAISVLLKKGTTPQQ